MTIKSIFIFHRALRIDDNIGLIKALKESDVVIPIFIFTPEQITAENKFRSLIIIKFMIDALIDLDESLRKMGSKLYIFYGKQHSILKQILTNKPDIDKVFINKDYTPYSIAREDALRQVTEKNNKTFEVCEDYLLHDVNTILNKSGSFYSVFTPFYEEALKHHVQKSQNVHKPLQHKFIKKTHDILNETTFDEIKQICKYDQINLFEFVASREEGLNRLENINNFRNYIKTHDSLTLETTRLSPYIKFGLVSVREAYHRIKSLYGTHHPLIRQLYWREFYYILSFNRQDILEDATSFRESYDNIKWKTNKGTQHLFELWKDGKTGYPVVDAGMRELNVTGFMHNRARLITSNFLVKHLFIDWREGETYFASKLIDYDPSVNNGNWQFTSGSGADSQPFFRMMNPWLQQEKHDKNCGYIKTWIPELINVPNEDIHDWQNKHQEHINSGIKYPAPCKVYDYSNLKKESKAVYSKAFNRK